METMLFEHRNTVLMSIILYFAATLFLGWKGRAKEKGDGSEELKDWPSLEEMSALLCLVSLGLRHILALMLCWAWLDRHILKVYPF